jgi:hypothetical protein
VGIDGGSKVVAVLMPMPRSLFLQIVLLLPQPLLSIAYVLAVGAEHLRPSVTPLLALTALPLASIGIGVLVIYSGTARSRVRTVVPLIVAVLELLWGWFSLAMVGLAIP